MLAASLSVLQAAQAQVKPAQYDVDVAIVLAADVSFSMDRRMLELQRTGHAQALMSRQVLSAIANNFRGCIAITYFEWSSPGTSHIVLPWTRICSEQDADAAGKIIASKAFVVSVRKVRGGTSISSAINIGSDLLDQFPGHADRKVIDISANGSNNEGPPLSVSRSAALDKGYTINVITLPNKDEPHLAAYFTDNVIGGQNAFVETPDQMPDYSHALRRKLVTEISSYDAVKDRQSVQ